MVPLGQVPTLTLANGQVVCQSSAIVRYAAKLAKLYPTDGIEALLVDEIMETCSECMKKEKYLERTAPQHPEQAEKKKLREAFVANDLPK